MDPLYYSLLAALGLLIVTPLSLAARQSRRMAALGRQPVAAGWQLRTMSDLDRARLTLYRLQPLAGGPLGAMQIRDQEGRRVGRIDYSQFEAPRIELNGREFVVYDQAASGTHQQWRGRVGGAARDSVVLHTDGKPVGEMFRIRSGLRRRWHQFAFHAGRVSIGRSGGGRGALDFTHEKNTVARVVQPDPTGRAGMSYAAIATNARPEFVAGVLYLAAQRA